MQHRMGPPCPCRRSPSPSVQPVSTERGGLSSPYPLAPILAWQGLTGLHERRVIHGDVHARNILCPDAEHVFVVDFGLAHVDGRDSPAGRGGTGYFFEPEYVAARLAGEKPPRLTFAAEQYAIAALVY
ncbi:MAG: protein kinase domain-containing protein [Candidatus Xenobia bacterium]